MMPNDAIERNAGLARFRYVLAALIIAPVCVAVFGCGTARRHAGLSRQEWFSRSVETSGGRVRFVPIPDDPNDDSLPSGATERSSWYVIFEHGRRVGVQLVREWASRSASGDQPAYVSVYTTQYSLRRRDDTIVTAAIQRYVESSTFKPLSFTYTTFTTASHGETVILGDIKDGRLVRTVSRTGLPDYTDTRPFDQSVLFPAGQKTFLRKKIAENATRFTYCAYHIPSDALTTITVTRLPLSGTGIPNNDIPPAAAYRVREINSLDAEPVESILDKHVELLQLDMPRKAVRMKKTSREDALTPRVPKTDDLFAQLHIVLEPAACPPPKHADTITYTIIFTEPGLDDIVTFQSRRQRILPIPRRKSLATADEPESVIRIRAATETPPLDDVNPTGKNTRHALNTDVRAGVDQAISVYLSPSPICESNDPRIRRLADSITRADRSDYAKARAVQTWIAENWRASDYKSVFLSAAQVHGVLRGDCTERAVYMIALLRSLSIPSRAVLGLVHSGDGFNYHMWVQAYVGGEWAEFDPTWYPVPVGAGHIGLATDALADVGLGKHAYILRKLRGAVRITWREALVGKRRFFPGKPPEQAR